MKTIMEGVGGVIGLFVAVALMIMIGGWLISLGPVGWIILAVLVLSK